MSGPPRSLDSSVITAAMLPPTLSPATARRSSVQAMFLPTPGDPLRRHIALLKGCRVSDLRAEPVRREHDRCPGSDREFAHQPVMRLRTAEHPPGPVDVHDDGERTAGACWWPQDAKSHLRAWAIGNGKILDVDRQLLTMPACASSRATRPFWGPRVKQQGWLRRSLRERLRLRF